MNAGEPNRLFVYGTLRKALTHGKFAILSQGARYLGPARAQGRMYDLGAYPGIVVSNHSEDHVLGELYSLDPAQAAKTWRALDEYEGCAESDPEPHEYDRKQIRVVGDDGREMNAWAYVLRNVPETAVLIPGGDYLAWRKNTSFA
jgi:gamma-glutamylcyclotransferase (GGCT)/AIG2-like uncharacterized protein YtfP